MKPAAQKSISNVSVEADDEAGLTEGCLNTEIENKDLIELMTPESENESYEANIAIEQTEAEGDRSPAVPESMQDVAEETVSSGPSERNNVESPAGEISNNEKTIKGITANASKAVESKGQQQVKILP